MANFFGELGTTSPILGIAGGLIDWRQRKMAMALEKQRAQAALDSVEREQGFRALEDPREQAQLRQSMFARGLGKSSVATQEGSRLTDIQARRNAALASQRDLAASGLTLIRRQRRYARRQLPFEIANPFVAQAKQAASMIGGAGGMPAAGAGE